MLRELTPRQRTVHGVTLGILMLDTGFQRVPGDIGHAATWPFPVQYGVVRGVHGPDVIDGRGEVLTRFVEAADALVRLGVDGITTSCGFLVKHQRALAARCAVPVATSSLLQIPSVAAMLPPGKRVGVLCAKPDALGAEHFAALGLPADLPVGGLSADSQFFRNNLSNAARVDVAEQGRELLACARALHAAHPDIGAIVSECANFAPYSADLAEALALPVFDIVSMGEWFHAGLRPRRFAVTDADTAASTVSALAQNS
ncbi:aspartate/glutamate racemase family protein [Chitinasiproducens palmae]|uniref:Asp/Glu/hydantoin racemase n=1 Tax=Chitinasiproducens palmae TaxID=1770053 RepID=A0A1H2PX66_9BURK|nr:aspartate/glutamate racemase family protein [Chitinasiproducens palmae]SDV51189.1 Asp/Glu/hydantoin racemase [Chitinasiproducens palmae]